MYLSSVFTSVSIYTIAIHSDQMQVYCPHLTGCSIAPSKRAVNRICLAIPRGEFFGFVGVNGKYMYMFRRDGMKKRVEAFHVMYRLKSDLK